MEQEAKDDVPDVMKLQKGTTAALWDDSMGLLSSKVPSAQVIATMAYVAIK